MIKILPHPMKRRIVLCILPLLFLASCDWLIGSAESIGCNFVSGKTQDHCYQDAAVRKADPDLCANIKAEDFTELQGPAPRDKCYLRIAEKTGNADVCEDIVGGTISYSQQECMYLAAMQSGDISICNRIQGSKATTFRGTFNKERCLEDITPVQQDYEEIDEALPDSELEGECKHDSHCPALCEGNIMWKQGCNARTNTCEKTFDYDCTAQTETVAAMSFGKICQAGECVRNTAAIQQKRTELSQQVKDWLNQRLEVTQLMQDANKNCLSALSDVTNKLIIDTAMKVASPPSALLDVGTDATMGIMDALASDPDAMSTEEFISLNCNLYKSLQTDLDVLEKKIDQAQDQARAINEALA